VTIAVVCLCDTLFTIARISSDMYACDGFFTMGVRVPSSVVLCVCERVCMEVCVQAMCMEVCVCVCVCVCMRVCV